MDLYLTLIKLFFKFSDLPVHKRERYMIYFILILAQCM